MLPYILSYLSRFLVTTGTSQIFISRSYRLIITISWLVDFAWKKGSVGLIEDIGEGSFIEIVDVS